MPSVKPFLFIAITILHNRWKPHLLEMRGEAFSVKNASDRSFSGFESVAIDSHYCSHGGVFVCFHLLCTAGYPSVNSWIEQ